MSKIIYEADGRIARITLNRPEKLNAIDAEMLDQLTAAAKQIDHSNEIRVVLIRANGSKAFSVGADIKAWGSLAAMDMWRRWIRDGQRVLDRIAGLRQPVIAQLNGYALGGGLELALAADIRLAADAAQLGFPEVRVATLPGWGGTERLPALIGSGRAKQMIFSGVAISAELAERWGLVNEVMPLQQLESRAEELAAQIAENAPIAVQLAKQAINSGSGAALEGIASALAAHSDDSAEGLASFREKRPAKFSGN